MSTTSTGSSEPAWKQMARDLTVTNPFVVLLILLVLLTGTTWVLLSLTVRHAWALSRQAAAALWAMEAEARNTLLGAGLSVLLFAIEVLRLPADRPLIYTAGMALTCVALLDAQRLATKNPAAAL
jgi:hypothetical protein